MTSVLTFNATLSNPINIIDNNVVYSNNNTQFNMSQVLCQNSLPRGCYNFFFDINPNSSILNWQQGGDFLSGITVNDIYTNPLFQNAQIQLTQTYTFRVLNGNQNRPGGRIIFYLIDSQQNRLFDNDNQPFPSSTVPGNSRGSIDTGRTIYQNTRPFSYNLVSTSSDTLINIAGVQAIANNVGLTSGFNSQQVNNATVQVEMTVQLQVTCNSSTTLSGICLRACTNSTSSLGSCVDAFQQACLEDVDTNNQPIIFGENTLGQNCRTFFGDYLRTEQGPGPNKTLDAAFSKICIAKFPGTSLEAYRNANSIEQTVCACHLNPQIYTNIQQSIQADFPGSQLAGEPDVCLLPNCASSDFRSTSSTKVCPIPACFELGSINNQGQITGRARIIQDCGNAAQPGSGNDPGNNGSDPTEPTKSWIERHWVWLVVGIALAVILIVIVIILASSGKKKPKNNFIM